MAENDEEHDMYVAQLRQVFDSCDTTGGGRLNRSELEELCRRLQLEEQSEALVQQLVGTDSDKRVGFDTFKEGFVAVLSYTIESSEDELNEDGSEELATTGGSLSPKELRCGVGRKRYGRRSIPEGTGSSLEGTLSSTTSMRAQRGDPGSRMSSFDQEEAALEASDGLERLRPPPPPAKHSAATAAPAETFEAEGQLPQNMSELENTLDPVSEEAHLREIWRELGVGGSGYISLKELGTVCEHIGMDEMSGEELSHLFDKLDVDQDGRVSFTEFLQGLFQHGGPHTPSSMTPSSLRPTPGRPRSTPRLKLKLAGEGVEGGGGEVARGQTPSFAHLGSGIFSAIDPENTGFASGEAVCELWESLGIRQGVDILELLQFDPHGRLSLTELSYALEQELRSMEEDNATFQAALVTYEQQLRFLKHVLEQKVAERDKLRAALTDSNARISLLVKESDERQAALERAKEKELAEVESRCVEQVRGLQLELDSEREQLQLSAAKQRARLEQQIERLREEEAGLRERLWHTQKALERLETDMSELAERADDLERQNQRLQRELDEKHSIQAKLEELESARALTLAEEQRFSRLKIDQLESENKELKDKSDELTMEVEELTQKLNTSRRRWRGVPGRATGGGADGDKVSSLLIEQSQARTDSTSELSEDDTRRSGSGRQRRRLPPRPGDPRSPVSDSDDLWSEEFSAKMVEVKASHNMELARLQRGYSSERKDLEDAYRLEIAETEDQHMREKNQLIKQLRAEQESLLEVQVGARLAERERDLRAEFSRERDRLREQHEAERERLERAFAEKTQFVDRLRAEFEEDALLQLAREREKHERQLETLVTRDSDGAEEHTHRIAELEEQLTQLQQREQTQLRQLQDEHNKQLTQMQDEHDKQLKEMQKENETQLQTLQQLHDTQLQDMSDKHEIQLQQLSHNHDTQLQTLTQQYDTQLQGLQNKHDSQLQLLGVEHEDSLQQLREDHHNELQQLKLQYETQLRQLQEEHDKQLDQLEDDLQLLETQRDQEARSQQQLFSQGADSLSGALKQDFDRLLVERTAQALTQEKQVLEQATNQERDSLVEQFTRQQEQLVHRYKQDRRELDERHQAKVNALQASLTQLQDSAAQEKRQLQLQAAEERERLEGERERLRREVEEGRKEVEEARRRLEQEREENMAESQGLSVEERAQLEDEIAEELTAQLEDEFLHQMGRLKDAFWDERAQLEGRVLMLEGELEEWGRTRDTEDSFRAEMDNKKVAAERQLKQQLEVLRARNSQLLINKQQTEERLAAVVSEKEKVLQALKVHVYPDQVTTSTYIPTNQSAVLDNDVSRTQTAPASQQCAQHIDLLTSQLTSQLDNYVTSDPIVNLDAYAILKDSHARLAREKAELEQQLAALKSRSDHTQGESHVSHSESHEQREKVDNSQSAVARWRAENSQLQLQLDSVNDKLSAATTALSLARSEHQRELQRMREESARRVDAEVYNSLHARLLAAEERANRAERQLEERGEEGNKLLAESREEHARSLRRVGDEKAELQRRLRDTEALLEQQVIKNKQQLKASSRTDRLVGELYVENARLMQCLSHSEQCGVSAERSVTGLEQKCRTLHAVLTSLGSAVARV